MSEATGAVQQWLERWAGEPYAYLATIGRQTGRPHRIEIWFAVQDGVIYLLSGARDRSDWIRNLQQNPKVTVELGNETRSGTAHVVNEGTADDLRARELLVAKYRQGDNLIEWGRTSLPVVIRFPSTP